MKNFHCINELCGYAVDCAIDESTVSILADDCLTNDILRWVINEDFVSIDSLEYDSDIEDGEYWCIFKVRDECDFVLFSICKASDDKRKIYLAPPEGIVLVDKYAGQCIADLANNPYSEHLDFDIYNLEDLDCDECCCEEERDEEFVSESLGDSVTVYKDKSGKDQGTNIRFDGTDGKTTWWSSHTYFSNDEKQVMEVVEALKNIK